MTTIWFAAVGMPFRKANPQDLRTTPSIKLEAEPDNQYDPEAIKISIELADNTFKHVGYVSRKDTARIKPHLSKNYSILVLDVYKRSAELCLECPADDPESPQAVTVLE